MLACKTFRRRIVLSVQLAPAETTDARNIRNIRPIPRAGGVNDGVRGKLLAGLQRHEKRAARLGLVVRGVRTAWLVWVLCCALIARAERAVEIARAVRAGQGADAADARRVVGPQLKLVLVSAVVGGDYLGGGGGGIGKRGGHARQIRDVVGLAQRQGIPPVTPGAAGGGVGIDKQKVLGGDKPAGGELVGRRQACLARADDDAEVVLHRAIVAGVKMRRMLWLTRW